MILEFLQPGNFSEVRLYLELKLFQIHLCGSLIFFAKRGSPIPFLGFCLPSSVFRWSPSDLMQKNLVCFVFFQRKDRRGSSKSLTVRKRSSLLVEPGCTVCGELSDQLWAHELLIWEINIFHRSLFSDQLSAHCLSSYLDQWSVFRFKGIFGIISSDLSLILSSLRAVGQFRVFFTMFPKFTTWWIC